MKIIIFIVVMSTSLTEAVTGEAPKTNQSQLSHWTGIGIIKAIQYSMLSARNPNRDSPSPANLTLVAANITNMASNMTHPPQAPNIPAPSSTGPFEDEKIELNLCNAILSPCQCNNSKCCGALSGNVMANCAYLLFAFSDASVPVVVNPCANVKCHTGTCLIKSILSGNGKVRSSKAECCSAKKFAQVNCGDGIDCQQQNKDGSYTVCCSPGCTSFN